MDDTQDISKKASSEKLESIFSGLNQSLQELADIGQPLFITPLGSPDSEGNTPVRWERIMLDGSADILDVPTEKIDNDIPRDGQQTVDYLVSTTKDLASVHTKRTPGYIFNSMCKSLAMLKTLRMEDVIAARKRLGLPTVLIESVAQCRKPTHQKEQTKPGTTVVHAERIVVDNKKMIKILKFECLVYMDDLPKDYLAGLPKFYRCNGWHKELIMLHETYGATSTLAYSVSPGTTMSLKDFGQMIKTMKEAAARLTKINKTAKLEREHSGKFTVCI